MDPYLTQFLATLEGLILRDVLNCALGNVSTLGPFADYFASIGEARETALRLKEYDEMSEEEEIHARQIAPMYTVVAHCAACDNEGCALQSSHLPPLPLTWLISHKLIYTTHLLQLTLHILSHNSSHTNSTHTTHLTQLHRTTHLTQLISRNSTQPNHRIQLSQAQLTQLISHMSSFTLHLVQPT